MHNTYRFIYNLFRIGMDSCRLLFLFIENAQYNLSILHKHRVEPT